MSVQDCSRLARLDPLQSLAIGGYRELKALNDLSFDRQPSHHQAIVIGVYTSAISGGYELIARKEQSLGNRVRFVFGIEFFDDVGQS
jgi:hypothetical protein